MNTLKFLIAFTLLTLGAAQIVRYDNYKVYSVIPHKKEHLQILKKLRNDYQNGCMFFSDFSFIGQPVDIMVSPQFSAEFNDIVKEQRLSATVKTEDVQKNIDREKIVLKAGENRSLDWTNYYTLETVCMCI